MRTTYRILKSEKAGLDVVSTENESEARILVHQATAKGVRVSVKRIRTAGETILQDEVKL